MEPRYDPGVGLRFAAMCGPEMIINVPHPSELKPPRSHVDLLAEAIEDARNDPTLLRAAGMSVEQLPFKPLREECRKISADLHDNCTWELCQPPVHEFAATLTYDQRELAIASACEYVTSIGFSATVYGITGFGVVDPEDYIDDELISIHVFKKTGLRTHWYPHRLDDEVPRNVGKKVYRKRPLICPDCGKEFKNSHAKHDHFRRGKCVKKSEPCN